MTPMIENPFTWMYLPTALTLGALHALEPGHAKTLTAAYLIGIKGTKRDALLLGLSVAATYSLVVIALSVAALWVGRETFTQDVSHWLQIGSGIIVILLGSWMLVRRIRQMKSSKHNHHHAPEPVQVTTRLAVGILQIINTPNGERFKFSSTKNSNELKARVIINRSTGLEILELSRISNSLDFISDLAPNEPHEFSAELELSSNGEIEIFQFQMKEPEDHHDHDLMNDDDHARAHASALPEYAKHGQRPNLLQIITFGAAGGMIPCPASITVMLLALSIGKFTSGLLAVLGFSVGLAITLVGVGLIIVAGLSRLQQGSGRIHWLSASAPIISAAVVILSGVAALMFAH